MQSTPLGPWEVGGSAGPAGAGLQGRYCSVADALLLEAEEGGKAKGVKDCFHDTRAVRVAALAGG